VFSIHMQAAKNVKDGFWWIWMHNDWLQALFETGIVGLSLMFGLYLQALRRLVITGLTAEAKTLLLFGIFMGSNYPAHVGLTCMFGAWLMCLALDVSNKDLQNELETSSMETVE